MLIAGLWIEPSEKMRARHEALESLSRAKKSGQYLTEQMLIDTLKGEAVYVYTYANNDNTVREYHCVREGFETMSHRIGDGHAFTGTRKEEGVVCGQTLWLRERNLEKAEELFREANLKRAKDAQQKANRAMKRVGE